MSAHANPRRGVALIDVILAMTLIGITAVALVAHLAQSFHTVAVLQDRESTLARAAAQLEEMSALWTVRDFERHRGTSRVNGFAVTIVPAAPGLFDVAVADSSGATLLETSFYLFESRDAGR